MLPLYEGLGCLKIDDEELKLERFKFILDVILEQSDDGFIGLELGKSFSFDFLSEVDMFIF